MPLSLSTALLWAKTAAGTHLTFFKSKSVAIKSWKASKFQPCPWPWSQAQVPTKISTIAKSRCYLRSTKLTRFTKSISGNIMRMVVPKRISTRISNIQRTGRIRPSYLNLNRSNLRLFSLIGLSLGLDSTNFINSNAENVLTDMKNLFSSYRWEAEVLPNPPKCLKDLDMSLETLETGCEGAVYKARLRTCRYKESNGYKMEGGDEDFNLAVKAIFNYGAASNADTILRELHREYVPLHMKDLPQNSALAARVGRLPPHPNIVDMPGVFEDDVRITDEARKRFPAALPRWLDPEKCYGRNKTLYLIMRRRSSDLKNYLATHDVSMETRCLLLAQLLEGVAHLGQNGIAHRDLKSNNLLVCIPNDGGQPKLEICDFGCCLAEESRSLMVPYFNRDMNRGGNSFLMAPEIKTATPGTGSVLDYRKSDLWASGAIAYEILGGHNPFYPNNGKSQRMLDSANYCEEDLPCLPEDVPEPIKYLVFSLLSQNPQDRPTPSVAAAIMQMIALDLCLTGESSPTSLHEILKQQPLVSQHAQVAQARRERNIFQWLVHQSQELTCQLTLLHDRMWDVPHVMRFFFLSRLTCQDFRQACAYF